MKTTIFPPRRGARVILAALALVWAIALAGLVGAQAPAASTTISLLHFNDLHAHLTPHADLVAEPGSSQVRVVERGGLARLATLVKQQRAQAPNSVLMNIGDTYHGGVEALFTQGNAIVDPVNALGIDVGTPGNWDFAYGPQVTRERYMGVNLPGIDIKGPTFPNLAANVTLTQPPNQAGNTMLPPTLIKTVGGVPVGFIGITSDIVPMMHEQLAAGFSFLQGEAAYRDLINQHAAALRSQGAQVVVVMSELGIHKDYRLAQIVAPGVDVFFSAHTHEATFQPLTSASGALVVEAGNDGYLGRMDITVANGAVTARNWQLLPIDASIAEDPAMASLVTAARAPFLASNPNMVDQTGAQRLTSSIATVVGHTTIPLDRRHALENSFNNAMADILRQQGGSALGMTPGFRFDSVIMPPGILLEDNTVMTDAITLEDVYRFFPVAYTIATGEVSGQRLQEIIEDNLDKVYSTEIFAQAGGWADGWSGLTATLDLANPAGQRVLDLRLADTGQPIANAMAVSVTGCQRPGDASDVLCSYSGFSNIQPLINPATSQAWTPIDLFVDALSRGALPATSRHSLTDLNRTPAWPADPFVQPLRGALRRLYLPEVTR